MPDLQLQHNPMNFLAPMPNLQLNSNQQQLQNSIRVMVESELARSRIEQRNPNQQTNTESATGSQQEAAQFHLA